MSFHEIRRRHWLNKTYAVNFCGFISLKLSNSITILDIKTHDTTAIHPTDQRASECQTKYFSNNKKQIKKRGHMGHDILTKINIPIYTKIYYFITT